MESAALSRRLGWALAGGGILAIVLVITMLPTSLLFAAFRGGPPSGLAANIYGLSFLLPGVLRWGVAPDLGSATGVCVVTVVLLSVLLLIAGGWPARVAALLGVIWSGHFLVAFSPSGYWARAMAARGTLAPAYVFTVVSVVVVSVVGITALATAVALGRGARA